MWRLQRAFLNNNQEVATGLLCAISYRDYYRRSTISPLLTAFPALAPLASKKCHALNDSQYDFSVCMPYIF